MLRRSDVIAEIYFERDDVNVIPFFYICRNALKYSIMKSLFRTVASAFLVFLCLSACNKEVPQDEIQGPGNSDTEIVEDTAALAMTEFKLLYYHNDNKFSDIVRFEIGESEITAYYEELIDMTSLVVDFKATGKAYVGDVEQVSGQTPNDFSKPVVYTLKNSRGETREYTVKLSCFTGLPIVYFNTKSGVNVKDKENWEDATIRIVDPNGELGMEETAVETKGRGNSTWNFTAKQPYALKFGSKTEVMGMPKHKRWILMANYRDRTMIRNAVAFELANRTGLAWTPRVEFVELIMNGKHRGNYMVTEQVRIDKNRIDVTELEKTDVSGDALTGGYVLEVDQWDDEVNMFKSKVMENKWGNTSCTIMLKFPDEDDAVPAHVDYIKNYIWEIEDLMLAGNFKKIYDDYIDIDSFIDFFFVQELVGNKEPWRGPYSTYMYKDRGEKLFAGPVWDFDFTTFMWYKDNNAEKIYNEKSAWYKYVLKDPIFKARMKERWAELKGGFSTMPDYIDELAAKLEKSAAINTRMFSPGLDSDIGGLFNGDETLPWEESIEAMKLYWNKKFNYFDNWIASF